MNDRELEQRLRTWYQAEVPADEAAPAALRSGVAAIPHVTPIPLRERSPGRGLLLVAAAAVLTTTLVVGAMLAGADPFTPPSFAPPSGAPSAEPTSALPSADPVADLIVYTRWKMLRRGEEDCTSSSGFCLSANTFVSDSDGSDERELLEARFDFVLTVSSDGSRVLVQVRDPDGQHMYLTDKDGSAPQRLQTHCQAPCVEDSYGFTFSPDGGRLAWVRSLANEVAVIAIMDMATGAVIELDSTAGKGAPPAWSPDGGRLAFAGYVVDADGSNLRQVVPAELFARDAQWSPDGSTIAFTSERDTIAEPGVFDNSQRLNDIFIVRPDGTGLQRLTTDTLGPLGTVEAGDFGAAFPTWTRDGHITFSRYPAQVMDPFELWIMDRDGSHARQLDPLDAAALTTLGCVVCAYPSANSVEIGLPSPIAFWISSR